MSMKRSPILPITFCVVLAMLFAVYATTTISAQSTMQPPAGQPLNVVQVNTEARPAIVQITNNQVVSGQFNSTSNLSIPAGVGTGFIFDKQGYILTNNHVVEGANSLTVATDDNKTYDGKIIGTYPQGDLAVVQITGSTNFPTVPLGDSNMLQVGAPVVAIGNALALHGGPTVTSGVVSALGRTEQEPSSGMNGKGGAFLVDLIQTDAAINPGNSGGPLLDNRGQVVGINTLGAGSANGMQSQGIGFAISINSAKPVADALIAGQPVPRPFFGVSTASLSSLDDAQLKLPAGTGAGITNVNAGSPADKAGIQQGDVIIKFDGQDVYGADGFASLLLQHKAGDTVTVTTLTIPSNNAQPQQQDVKVTLVQYPK